MTDHAVHYTSARTATGRDNWCTPKALFDKLDAEFGFVVDAAADADSALCPMWYGPGSTYITDATATEWLPRPTFCNPPYSLLREFLAHGADACSIAPFVFLIPARTDTRAWHESVMARASEVRLIKGRIYFGWSKAGAPFPSAIVVFRGFDGRLGPPRFSSLVLTPEERGVAKRRET